MDILQYLIALLKDSKQIGVEGLGTFYKQKNPGRYDAETHSFLPPSYVLRFTDDVLENNNLISYIQTQRGVSEETAKYFVSQFVDQFKNDLENGEQMVAQLGTFSIVDQRVQFKPDENIDTGADFFALPKISAKDEVEIEQKITEEAKTNILPVAEIEEVKAPDFDHEINKVEAVSGYTKGSGVENIEEIEEASISPIVEPEPTENEVYEEISEVSHFNTEVLPPAAPTPSEQRVEEKVIIAEQQNANEYEGTQDFVTDEPKAGNWLAKISIVTLILLAIASAIYFLKPELFNINRAKPIDKALTNLKRDGLKTKEDSLAFADSVMEEAQKVGLDVKPAKDTLKVTTTAKPVPAVTYDIIGAAFARLSEADEYIQIMKKKGFDAKIAKMPGKTYKKISIASYDNIDTARKYIEIYKEKLNNTTIYVQTIKNK